MNEQEKWDPQKKAEAFAASLDKRENCEQSEELNMERSPTGVINPKLVRTIFFVIVSVGIFFTGAICILAVWGYVVSETAWRSVATLIIIALSFGIFIPINEAFGWITKR